MCENHWKCASQAVFPPKNPCPHQFSGTLRAGLMARKESSWSPGTRLTCGKVPITWLGRSLMWRFLVGKILQTWWIWEIAMGQNLWMVPYLGGWTSMNPIYFDVHIWVPRFWPIKLPWLMKLEGRWNAWQHHDFSMIFPHFYVINIDPQHHQSLDDCWWSHIVYIQCFMIPWFTLQFQHNNHGERWW